MICEYSSMLCRSDISDAAFDALIWNRLTHVDKLFGAGDNVISGTSQNGAYVQGSVLYTYRHLYEDPVVAYDGFQTAVTIDAALGLWKAGTGAAKAITSAANSSKITLRELELGNESPHFGDSIRFGNNANQERHAFRHLEEKGISRQSAESAIRNDLASQHLSPGQNLGSVNVNGKTLQYNAYKLQDGTINVGRITVEK
jgi:hypothetical protein